jgi:hypothetical protein
VSSKADEGYWREKAAALGAVRGRKGRGSKHVGEYTVEPVRNFLATVSLLWHCHV